MTDRWKRPSLPLVGVIFLTAGVLPEFAFQRSGSGAGGDCDTSLAVPGGVTGAAGLDRTLPCPPPASPPASDPAVKAKLDFNQNLKDAARLSQLAAEIQRELENSGSLTLSAGTVKKSEEAEKLAKRLHDRMKGANVSAQGTSDPNAARAGKVSGGR